jgi:hypothetical protein
MGRRETERDRRTEFKRNGFIRRREDWKFDDSGRTGCAVSGNAGQFDACAGQVSRRARRANDRSLKRSRSACCGKKCEESMACGSREAPPPSIRPQGLADRDFGSPDGIPGTAAGQGAGKGQPPVQREAGRWIRLQPLRRCNPRQRDRRHRNRGRRPPHGDGANDANLRSAPTRRRAATRHTCIRLTAEMPEADAMNAARVANRSQFDVGGLVLSSIPGVGVLFAVLRINRSAPGDLDPTIERTAGPIPLNVARVFLPAVSQVSKPAGLSESRGALGRGSVQPTGKSAKRQSGMSALRRESAQR